MKNPWAGLRGLPRTVWIVFATSLTNRAGMMALPFLVLYLTRHLGTSASLAGLAVSAYGLGGIVTGPIAGRLCDRVGPFTVMRVSLALTGVILMIIPLAHRFSIVVLLVFVWALVADATRPATMSALTTAAAPDQRKAAIALNRLGVNLGMSVGPAVGGFLALVSFPLLFVVDGLTSLRRRFTPRHCRPVTAGEYGAIVPRSPSSWVRFWSVWCSPSTRARCRCISCATCTTGSRSSARSSW
jgi:predicted MFS family arabinose efflux permease